VAFRCSLLLASFLFTAAAPAATTRNDDSCDISITPAATLLLPYFETDPNDRLGEKTLFTVTNTSPVAQAARVTLWTDFSYPVLTFNLYLTGYDVHSLSLYDVLNGRIGGRPLGTGGWVFPQGEHSRENPLLDESECGRLPTSLSADDVAKMQSALMEGRAGTCNKIGNLHELAVGYITIDVVGNCGSASPLDARYFAEDLRYDNVLVGDYQQVNAGQDFARGSPMVHIRAIPEGGTPQSRAENPRRYATNLPRTFYGRFQDPARPHADARQPLPSTFAARWVNGGRGSLQTSFKIWREGRTGAAAACRDYEENARIQVAESVMFDEDDNGEGIRLGDCTLLCCHCFDPGYPLPGTSLTRIDDYDVFPQDVVQSDPAGWIYLNLDDGHATEHPLQAWVVISMRAEGRYSVDFDAAVLGNGCSDNVPLSEFSDGGTAGVLPGPAPDAVPQ
jgi:hypothetical protein